jgi:ribosomal-protein-serine acetyltransferase
MEKRSLPSTLENSRVILRKHSADLAYQMFQEINQDRDRLRQFLPWVDAMKSVDDQIWYINECIKDWAEGTMFDYGIFDFEGNYLGNIGVHSLAWEHDRGELGYWISPSFAGKGFNFLRRPAP